MSDLIERLNRLQRIMSNAVAKQLILTVWSSDVETVAEAATSLEAKDKELAALRLEFENLCQEFDVRNAENTELEKQLFAARQGILREGMARNDAERRVAELEAALKPFAKAGELFDAHDPDHLDICIYAPAAGEEYWLSAADLRAARAVINKGEKT